MKGRQSHAVAGSDVSYPKVAETSERATMPRRSRLTTERKRAPEAPV